MKNLFLLSLSVVLAACSSREVPAPTPKKLVAYSYYVWQNDSDRPLRIEVLEAHHSLLIPELKPGEKYEEKMRSGSVSEDGGYIGWTDWLPDVDKFSVVFDGGALRAEYSGPDRVGNHPYPQGYAADRDPALEQNYTQEKVDIFDYCDRCHGRRLTYRFTEADYQTAKAMAEAAKGTK